VKVTGVSGALNSGPITGNGTQQAGGPDRPVGTLTVSGTATSRAVIAGYVDALSRVTGLADPLVTNASTTSGTLQFSLRLDITRAILGGRFTEPSASPSAGK